MHDSVCHILGALHWLLQPDWLAATACISVGEAEEHWEIYRDTGAV